MRNLQPLTYVKELPWQNVAYSPEGEVTNLNSIISDAKLDWGVDYTPMYTDYHDKVQGYHAIYRKDTMRILGVVNRPYPSLVQNSRTFDIIKSLYGDKLEFHSAGAINDDRCVFGVFKLKDEFKLIDDSIDHYLIILNDHITADGKVTVFNTPVRIVCSNAISGALSASHYKLRIAVPDDDYKYDDIAARIISSSEIALARLRTKAEKMLKLKVPQAKMDLVLEELFPEVVQSKFDDLDGFEDKNMQMDLNRETFINECVKADNLANYNGTFYQLFNAATDYSQHYFAKLDKSYDLTYRMKTLPGFGSDGTAKFVDKLLKLEKMFAA